MNEVEREKAAALISKMQTQVAQLEKVRAAYEALKAAGVTGSQEQLDAIYRMTLKRIAKSARDFFFIAPEERKPIQELYCVGSIRNEIDYTIINQLIEEEK